MNIVSKKHKRLVLEAFDTLFNKRDRVAAERFWSRDGVFNLVRTLPPASRWESGRRRHGKAPIVAPREPRTSNKLDRHLENGFEKQTPCVRGGNSLLKTTHIVRARILTEPSISMGKRFRQDVNLSLNDGEILFDQSGSNGFDSGVREEIA
jgi:hypothetical protein